MLLPKRVKFRKQHRGRMTGKAMRGNTVSHGEYGLQALQPAWITSNQIEAARKGKGAPEYWVAVVKPGRVMFEIAGVPEETAREAMRLAMHKLPIKCKFVKRDTQETGGEQ